MVFKILSGDTAESHKKYMSGHKLFTSAVHGNEEGKKYMENVG